MKKTKDDLIKEALEDLDWALTVYAIETSPPGTAEMLRHANKLVEGLPAILRRALEAE